MSAKIRQTLQIALNYARYIEPSETDFCSFRKILYFLEIRKLHLIVKNDQFDLFQVKADKNLTGSINESSWQKYVIVLTFI